MALLETIVAMTIFTVAGLSAVAWARQTLDAVEQARGATRSVRAAGDYLARIALWPRDDLDRHLGARRQGAWVVTIERLGAALYVVSIRDTLGRHVLMQTALYRHAL